MTEKYHTDRRAPIVGSQVAYHRPHRPGEDARYPAVESGFVTGLTPSGQTAYCRFWKLGHPGALRTRDKSEAVPVCYLTYPLMTCVLTVPLWIVDWFMDRIEKGLPLPATRPYRFDHGETFLYHAQGSWCDATILAVLEDEDRALLEYIGRQGIPYLRIVNRTIEAEPTAHNANWWGKVRSVTYDGLPKKWLRATCQARALWGHPLGYTPQETWEKRYPDELWRIRHATR